MKITFIIENRWDSYLVLRHENKDIPYKKRTVTIELTKEQIEKLNLKPIGTDGGKDVFEDIRECFVENS